MMASFLTSYVLYVMSYVESWASEGWDVIYLLGALDIIMSYHLMYV